MKIYDVVVQNNEGTRPDQDTTTQRVWAENAQQAVDKVRRDLGLEKGDKKRYVVVVSQNVRQDYWE